MYFVADPAQPLDGNLHATWFRINSAKTAGEFDVHRPVVVPLSWGSGTFHMLCTMLAVDTLGKKVSSVEDVAQLFEKLEVSPGGGLLSDGSVTIRVGSDV